MKPDSHKREKKASESFTEIKKLCKKNSVHGQVKFTVHGKYSLLHPLYHNFEGKVSRSMASAHTVPLTSRQARRTQELQAGQPQSLGNLLPFEIQLDFWEVSGNSSYLYGIVIPYSLMGRMV